MQSNSDPMNELCRREECRTLLGVASAVLDPFLQLPIEISRGERRLLHFYLTHGRQNLEISASPAHFDPGIYAGSRLLQCSEMYVLSHIAMGGWMLRKTQAKEALGIVHARRARAYNLMNRMLSTTETPFLLQVSGLFQLVVMEKVFEARDILVRHLQALYQLIEASGGLARFHPSKKGFGPDLGVSFVTAFFVFAEIPIEGCGNPQKTLSGLATAVESFRFLQITANKAAESNTPLSKPHLSSLRVYVDWLLSTYLTKQDVPFQYAAGALGFILNLGISQTAYDLDRASSIRFLRYTERSMEMSRQPCQLNSHCSLEVFPCNAIWLLGHVRRCILPVGHEQEVEIAQATLDLLKILPFLSCQSRLKLAQVCAKVAFAVVDGTSASETAYIVEEVIEEVLVNCVRSAQ